MMKNILIIRPSAIGDIVMASAMLPVLRRSYPKAHIAWLADSALAGLLENHPDLDEVIHWPRGRWKRLARERKWPTLFREWKALVRRMRSRRFDLCLDVQGLFRSRLFARLSGARQRIGFESKEPGRFLMTRVVGRGPASDRMSSEYRHLMELLGLDPGRFAPRIDLSGGDRSWAREILGKSGAGPRYAVFAPFTTRPQKHWFAERWAELAGRIKDELALETVILGGPGDLEAAGEILALAGGRLISLVGQGSLTQSAAVIEGCSLLVGVDTGLTHMGTAFDRPTVALFGSTCPYRETASTKSRVLYQKMPCSPCRRNPVCEGRFDCLAALTVDGVMATARELIEEAARADEDTAH